MLEAFTRQFAGSVFAVAAGARVAELRREAEAQAKREEAAAEQRRLAALREEEARRQAALPVPMSSALQTWKWFGYGTVVVRSNETMVHLDKGKARDSGTWRLVTPQGPVRMTWKSGWIDDGWVSADGDCMSGKNQKERLSDVYRD